VLVAHILARVDVASLATFPSSVKMLCTCNHITKQLTLQIQFFEENFFSVDTPLLPPKKIDFILVYLLVSLCRMTYRVGFPSIEGFTNDCGWGCMMRAGQMALANCMIRLLLPAGEITQEKKKKKGEGEIIAQRERENMRDSMFVLMIDDVFFFFCCFFSLRLANFEQNAYQRIQRSE
jgi:hypothetical protein